ncbi:MAG: Flp family type IVb pilin [Paracoccaceae bacterium]
MLELLKDFLDDEDGAITADWVVLTAAISISGLIAATAIWGGTNGLSDQISTFVHNSGTTFIASEYW